jgi:RNA polymerase sigma-70 factor (ECF subfamily)
LKNYATLSELELLGLIARHDSKALEALYDSFSPLLYTLTKEIIEDTKTAENTLADIFTIIWRRSKDFHSSSGGAYCWIVQLARNKAIDVRRRKYHSDSAYPKYTVDYENQYILPVVSAELNSRISISDVKNLSHRFAFSISELTDAQRLVIRMAFYEGLTQGEISSKLNIPLQTVKSKVKNALLNLISTVNFNGTHEETNWKLDDTHYALAAGCLEKDEYLGAKKTLFESEDLVHEYAELQKIISFIPINLDPEALSPKLKNLVAIKLIKYQKETAPKIPEKKNEVHIRPDINDQQIQSTNIPELKISDRAPVEFVEIKEHSEKQLNNSEFSYNSEINDIEEPDIPNNKKRNIYSVIITFAVIFLSVALVFLYIYQNHKMSYLSYKNELLSNGNKDKEKEIKSLQKYKKIIGLLTAEKVSVTNLSGTAENPEGFARITFFKNYSDALLQLYNMHIPKKAEGYRLWAVSGEKYYSLGLFQPEKEVEYSLIENISPDDLSKYESFIITEETGNSLTAKPSDKVLLSGKPGK